LLVPACAEQAKTLHPFRLSQTTIPTRLFFALLLLGTTAAFAADLRAIPAQPVAKKKELLFSDDFTGAELGKTWAVVAPTFSVENWALKGTQMRFDAPAMDATPEAKRKPAVKGHQAVIGTEVATKDSVVEFRFRLAGAQSVTAEFDDRQFTGSHYGHICMARIAAKSIILTDQKEGCAKNEIQAMANAPSKKAGRAKLMAGRSATFPLELDAGTWHDFTLETVGDTMRATTDGKPVALLKSPGIAHTTKSKVEFGCMGRDEFLDEIKIWNAEPVKQAITDRRGRGRNLNAEAQRRTGGEICPVLPGLILSPSASPRFNQHGLVPPSMQAAAAGGLP